MSDEELHIHIAKQQNTMDNLTRKVYGSHVKFENLSPFGQHTIESLARERALISDPDPELRHAKVEAATLRAENSDLQSKLTEALKENQDLWERNEELLIEIYDYEEDRASRRKGRRQDSTT